VSASLVLLVEDEALLLLALQDALQEAGYQVLACGSGTEAMRKLDAETNNFTGLICDIRLGAGPDGWAVARHARELLPGLPVVYMTGDSAADWTVQGVPESVLISKPFVTTQIIVAITQLINAAPIQQEPQK